MAAATKGALHTTYSGDPNRVIPIRNTATSGDPEDVDVKEGLKHSCHYFSDIDNGSTYTYGRPVRSAAVVLRSTGTAAVAWDPDDSTGVITFSTSAANQTGWCHIWSRD